MAPSVALVKAEIYNLTYLRSQERERERDSSHHS